MPVVSLDGDGQFKSRSRGCAGTSAAPKPVACWSAPQRSERARRGARFPGGGRAATCAIAGQNAEPDARAELREARSPLVASVGFFPERYGDGLISWPSTSSRMADAAGRLHPSPSHHRRERRPLLSERRAGRRRQRHRDWRGPPCVSRSETTSRALRSQNTQNVARSPRNPGPAVVSQIKIIAAGRVRL